MSRASKIKYIVIHCTAGFSSGQAVQKYFTRSKELGGRGWNTGGYHRIIERNGTIYKPYTFDRITNGVRGFNSECIHISYVGGVNRDFSKNGVYVSEDTRTTDQKLAIEKCIVEAILWLSDNGKNIHRDLMILGHRDFSKDQNENGIIEPYERIKDCPSFDVISEYNHLYGATGSIQTLPKSRKSA